MSDETLRWSVRLLAHVAGELHHAWCGGSEACNRRATWLRGDPSPGDLVVEMSMHHWPQGERGLDHFTRIGRYLGRDDVEETFSDGETWTNRGELIALADGTLFRWTNCDLRRVPEETIGNLTGECFRWGQIGRVSLRDRYVTPPEWAATLATSGTAGP